MASVIPARQQTRSDRVCVGAFNGAVDVTSRSIRTVDAIFFYICIFIFPVRLVTLLGALVFLQLHCVLTEEMALSLRPSGSTLYFAFNYIFRFCNVRTRPLFFYICLIKLFNKNLNI